MDDRIGVAVLGNAIAGGVSLSVFPEIVMGLLTSASLWFSLWSTVLQFFYQDAPLSQGTLGSGGQGESFFQVTVLSRKYI